VKSIVLKKLADELNIEEKNIVAIGDGNNDIAMMKLAGLSIAMENAVDKAKENADIITKSNNDNGVKYAIENFVL